MSIRRRIFRSTRASLPAILREKLESNGVRRMKKDEI